MSCNYDLEKNKGESDGKKKGEREGGREGKVSKDVFHAPPGLGKRASSTSFLLACDLYLAVRNMIQGQPLRVTTCPPLVFLSLSPSHPLTLTLPLILILLDRALW